MTKKRMFSGSGASSIYTMGNRPKSGRIENTIILLIPNKNTTARIVYFEMFVLFFNLS